MLDENIVSRVPLARSITSIRNLLKCRASNPNYQNVSTLNLRHKILSQQHTIPQHTSINRDIVDLFKVTIFIALRKQRGATPRTLLGHRSTAFLPHRHSLNPEAYPKIQNLTTQRNSENYCKQEEPGPSA